MIAAFSESSNAGFRVGIEAVWWRERLPEIPVYAAQLAGDDKHGLQLVFDKRYGDCPACGPGHCKGAVVRSLRREGDFVVAFGDGSRDLCMAREADCVFARGGLARLCECERIPWLPLEDFNRPRDELLENLDVGA